MSVSLTLDPYLQSIRQATGQIITAAGATGLDARVPTCPDWTMAHLLAHMGMVHRWAQSQLLATEAPFVNEESVLETIPAAGLAEWLSVGSNGLVETLDAVDPEIEAPIFLPATGLTPLMFWARRQAHETVIHAADAMSAVRGGYPMAADLAITPQFAADGLDELLYAMAPLGRSKLFTDVPYRILVAAADIPARWTLYVTADALTCERMDTADPEVTWSGSAAELYLALWNRGESITISGSATPLLLWRERHQIRRGRR
ncbi:maleylpyruvate isomerase family mycothiol-dependent enzyme [Williamsia sp. CHRR-6]|uniref:maleylpyruvate isomerase family mycothiol-dependent enzyme n=1 Tax=Williamsia sp. CHRR-6 TaxID=2835871 RepID=UPI001BDA2C15|nr:maleylpyruvate isomerase family mycothiol-dependent enzyme [Williamsia sp. CHRR-6]MBT0567634.1 maleylpyruvate isomerase family mycothiol-dependent enzyme [Williamsia sp. CHRR-6]